jgi:hypothetical protein
MTRRKLCTVDFWFPKRILGRREREKVEYKSNSKCAGLVGAEGKNGKYEGAASQTGLIVE